MSESDKLRIYGPANPKIEQVYSDAKLAACEAAVQHLQARVDELEAKQDYLEIPLFLRNPEGLAEDVKAEFDKQQRKIAKLTAALERIANDYFTPLIEGEETWQFLDRELTATKEHAQTALNEVSDE